MPTPAPSSWGRRACAVVARARVLLALGSAVTAAVAAPLKIDSNNAGFNGTGFANFPVTGGYAQFSGIGGGSAGGPATGQDLGDIDQITIAP